MVDAPKPIKIPATFDGETVVYSAYAKSGRLLYVGIADNFFKRMGQHAQKAIWWQFVVRFELEPYATRHQAMVREKYLIRYRHPAHNEQHQDAANLARIRGFKARFTGPVCKRCESSPPADGEDLCAFCRDVMPEIDRDAERHGRESGSQSWWTPLDRVSPTELEPDARSLAPTRRCQCGVE